MQYASSTKKFVSECDCVALLMEGSTERVGLAIDSHLGCPLMWLAMEKVVCWDFYVGVWSFF